jgi:hypothetical protein
MKIARQLLWKYGIRYGGAYVVSLGILLSHDTWGLGDVVGTLIVTGLVVAASYRLEAWFSKPTS